MKNEYFIIMSIFIILFIVVEVRKSHLSIKESFYWIIGSILVLILSIFPKIIDKVAKFFGVDYPPSIFFVFVILFLLYLLFRLNRIQALHSEEIRDLVQQVAILKEKASDKKNKK